MDMRSLEVFSAVLRAGTATRAAELLRTSQPAVSRTIARLERAAGMALFVRSGGRLLPTEEALLLHREVEAAFRGLDRVREAAARIRERGPGVLRLACLPAMAARVAPRAVAAFRAAWPGVRVSLEVTDSLGVRDLVGGGRADLGLAADEAEAAGLRRETFAEAMAVCAVPRGHPLAARAWLGPADLAGEPFLALAPEDATRRRLDRVLGQAGVGPLAVAVETPYAATVAALSAAGAGIGLVNPLALPEVPDGRIVLVPFRPGVPFRTLLLRPAGQPSSRPVAAMVRLLRESVTVTTLGPVSNDRPSRRG